MEALTAPRVNRGVRALALLLAPLALLPSAGCVTLGPLLPGSDGAAGTAPCQVVAWWSNQVMWTPDPTHGGALTPGLAGRVYLFGPEIDFPLIGDGALVVDLLDPTAVTPDGSPVLLEEWRLDRDTLKRLLKRDMVGWGYTVFLPWGTYKPEVNRIQLMVRFEPTNRPNLPLYAQSATLTLAQEEPTGPALTKRNAPGNAAAKSGTPAANRNDIIPASGSSR
jgi:hypothetical protein